MIITRHFLDVEGRRVHYRKAGEGPPLLMIHQSPRSSAEYEGLMREWSGRFTCIAPDTPGFGQSDPLPGAPEIDDFADAVLAFMDAVGLGRCAAYGFHSGGIILMTALRRRPERFETLAIGGYAVWTEEERALFADRYLPAFRPSAYGEHLAWLWSRVLEQSWFFPWFDLRDEARLPGAHDDPERVDAVVRELLDSGDAYRAGYGAVLRAPRDIPDTNAAVPPVLITAYDGDPLQAHLARLGPLPRGWEARPVATPAEHRRESFEFLAARVEAPCPALAECGSEGFVHVEAAGFSGLVHWRGDGAAGRAILHGPGESLELIETDALAVDLPGHGLSDDFASNDPEHWAEVAAAALANASCTDISLVAGQGLSALFAPSVARRLGAEAEGVAAHIPCEEDREAWLEQLFDPAPDRFGSHLAAAWQIARAGTFFWPWFRAGAASAIPFDPGAASPERLALRHRALMRGRGAAALTRALLTADRARLIEAAPIRAWRMADWAMRRTDLWKPIIEGET
ncbi:MAG: alpha/beta fold hydrolase [Allosphingosinicella sp.]|uniref:alpha/beta fold hydrolase n=1 Tax=Allosphingosinicella sp. TaxID=2823234 RepID=UPI0039623952